ncbi:MAG: hypothetical protein JO307_01610 [Bryobacterales bacterium]|nr:hypothetical protein [Bryobacterales bacterium]MBV9397043.1 hypothetical protein [Bryobacterales bacterium]
MRKRSSWFACIVVVSVPLCAQIGPPPSQGASKPTPRLADGRPDLGNAGGSWFPRIVDDISGNGGGEKDEKTRARQKTWVDKRVDVPFQPWAKELYEKRDANLSKEDPEGKCLPPGIPRMMNTPFPMQMYQLPDRILQVYEGGAHMWRVIYMDGRAHPKGEQLNPTYLGHAVGHWDGDTLVVDVVGFNDRTWLDAAGHPHTEQLHVIERYTRINQDVLHYEATIDDPGAYTAPWTVGWQVAWQAGMEPLEYVCQENNADLNHLIGLKPGEKHP